MLSDNGLLLSLYADGALLWREMAQTAEGIADWAIAQMRDDGGGFYSSLDADSDGGEGAFYVWDSAEIKTLLDNDENEILNSAFALSAPPNFEGKHWHLTMRQTPAQTAQVLNITSQQYNNKMASAKSKLLAQRNKRNRPALDDKILTGWNALMIHGLARAGRVWINRNGLRRRGNLWIIFVPTCALMEGCIRCAAAQCSAGWRFWMMVHFCWRRLWNCCGRIYHRRGWLLPKNLPPK